jgi:hypothetical protein
MADRVLYIRCGQIGSGFVDGAPASDGQLTAATDATAVPVGPE